MTLDELVAACVASSAADWLVHEDGGHPVDPRGQPARAAYKPDLAIGLAWGLVVTDPFQEPWANSFADSHASTHWLDVLYNDALVDRQLYVAVDGGRMYLPLPDREFEGDPSDGVVARLTITPAQDAFFRVLASMATSHDFGEYVRRAGIEILR